MTSTIKLLKEKPGPRLVPRATAASAARAARNATNRLLSATPRQSPIRHPAVTPAAFSKGEMKKEASVNDEDELHFDNADDGLKLEEAKHLEENCTDLNDGEEKNPDASEYSFCEAPKTSRPQTPKSRPSTPAQRPAPATAAQGQVAPRRPTTPSAASTLPTPATVKSIPQNLNFDGDLQNMYSAKQNEFHRLKKELDLKQQSVLEVFDALRHIQERLQSDGIQVRETVSQELTIFNVGDWTNEEITQLCRDAQGSAGDRAPVLSDVNPLDDAAIAALESQAARVPDHFAELCLRAFTARQQVIDWIKDLADKNEIPNDGTKERITQYNVEGLQLYGILEETKTQSKNTMDALTAWTKRFCQERSTLIRVEESLLRSSARLQHELETRNDVVAPTDVTNALEDSRRELDKERAAKSQLKEKLVTTESQLRHARARVAQMDRQLREAEASIAGLTSTVKSLEDKSRQREISLESRARKLKESLKTGEVTTSQLVQQRDAARSELNELRENIKIKENQYKTQIEELNERLERAIASREHERQAARSETEVKQHLEEQLNISQSIIDELHSKINDLEKKHNSDLPTEREMDLLSQLNAVKDTLCIAEDEIIACKNEKIRFLESFTKLTDSDEKLGTQQKLAAELMSKEEIISNMQIQIRELINNVKLNEKKVVQYAQYVRELRARAADRQDCPDAQACRDLQNEVMDLKMHLLEVSTKNEELLGKLAEKNQLLEQHDKSSRAQARLIQVREELISMLKNKESEQSRELCALQQDLEHRMKVVDDVNKQISAKASEIKDLFSTLENKQHQIQRLEKIVVALEEQQRRAQAQRTRHEEKIDLLERELRAAADGVGKERKFLFF